MKKYIYLPLIIFAATTLSSCIDEVEPIDSVLPEQVMGMENSQKVLLDGLVAYVNDFATYSSSDVYYYNDYGYPCQMMVREVQGADFPVNTDGGNFNYWNNVEQSTGLTNVGTYAYYYYFRFIRNANTLLSIIGDPYRTSEESRHYYGCALVFRALSYLDLARLFEYQPTGITALDTDAEETGIMGLTVPIVDENTTAEQQASNPRVPFYKMYRFILNDLNRAEFLLQGYTRDNGNYPDLNVVYGLKARFWLELATRFDRSADDLKLQKDHEDDLDGYEPLGITSARDCYQNAKDYAQKAQQGYTPMSQQDWQDQKTGFNTAASSWIWYSTISEQEQQGNYYSTQMGTICTEATWGMCQYGGSGNYRCIGSWLYDQIKDGDWRKTSWISEEDATAAKWKKNMDREEAQKIFSPLRQKYDINTGLTDSVISLFPSYANLKFRSRNPLEGKMIAGLMCDIPLMRAEEMIFIEAEATANLDGVSAGATVLSNFVNTYRYIHDENGYTYTCKAKKMEDFIDELMVQRRIELWGEGLTFFDYKRLRLPVQRSLNTNYISAQVHDSKTGYVCPTMNYYIGTGETNINPAVKRNPNPTNWFNKK